MNRKDYISDNLINLGKRLNTAAVYASASQREADNPRNASASAASSAPAPAPAAFSMPAGESAAERRSLVIYRSRQDIAMRLACELSIVEEELAATERKSRYRDFLQRKIAELEQLEDDGSQDYFKTIDRIRLEFFSESSRRNPASGSAASISGASASLSSLGELLRLPPQERTRLLFAVQLPLICAVLAGALIIAAVLLIALL